MPAVHPLPCCTATVPVSCRGLKAWPPGCRLPAFYGQKFQRRVKAGAACEDLRVRCPHFYDVGCEMHSHLDNPDLGAFLQSTFSERYRVLPARACKQH